MDLSLKEIYLSALTGLKKYPVIYLLLLIWGLIQGFIAVFMVIAGAPFWMAALMTLEPEQNPSNSAFYITLTYFGIIGIVLALLSSATRAGVLAFGANIRKGEKATIVTFVDGIFRYTWRLFIGGIIIAMLTWIPLLAFATFIRYTFSGMVSDIFTSGWNINYAFSFFGTMFNSILVAGIFQTLIFFWISPWDEMVVLNKIGFSDALLNSLTFVFSARHFLRVLSLIISNVLIAQGIMILVNIVTFTGYLKYGIGLAYLAMLLHSPTSTISSFVQFLLYPFFAFSQLYLLPNPVTKDKSADEIIKEPETGFGYPIKV